MSILTRSLSADGSGDTPGYRHVIVTFPVSQVTGMIHLTDVQPGLDAHVHAWVQLPVDPNFLPPRSGQKTSVQARVGRLDFFLAAEHAIAGALGVIHGVEYPSRLEAASSFELLLGAIVGQQGSGGGAGGSAHALTPQQEFHWAHHDGDGTIHGITTLASYEGAEPLDLGLEEEQIRRAASVALGQPLEVVRYEPSDLLADRLLRVDLKLGTVVIGEAHRGH